MASDFVDRVKKAFQSVESIQGLPVKADDDGTLGSEPWPPQSPLDRLAQPEAVRSVAVPLTDTPLEGTRGKRMVPVSVPEGMNAYEFNGLLGAAYNVYLQDGIISPERMAELSGLPVTRCYFVLDREEFAYALAVRGISLAGRQGLTPEQDHALLILGDTTSKATFNERLRRAQISNAKLRAWMKNPIFARAYNGLAETTAQSYESAMLELHRKAGDGDLRAIEKVLAISGRYNDDSQTRIDMMAFMSRVVEILSVRLAGQPKLLGLIAQDLNKASQETLEHGNPISKDDIIPGHLIEG